MLGKFKNCSRVYIMRKIVVIQQPVSDLNRKRDIQRRVNGGKVVPHILEPRATTKKDIWS